MILGMKRMEGDVRPFSQFQIEASSTCQGPSKKPSTLAIGFPPIPGEIVAKTGSWSSPAFLFSLSLGLPLYVDGGAVVKKAGWRPIRGCC